MPNLQSNYVGLPAAFTSPSVVVEPQAAPDCLIPIPDCRGERRRFGDLLARSRTSSGDAILPHGPDRLLYCAHRNVRESEVAPNSKPSDSADVICALDSVCYAGGVLETNEVARSIGHWNPATQWEVFEVQSGTVILFLQQHPNADIHLIRATPGEMYYLSPGSWHTTYIAYAHAVVWNIYPLTETGSLKDKYSSDRKPPAITLQRSEYGMIHAVGPEVIESKVTTWTADSAPAVQTVFSNLLAVKAAVTESVVTTLSGAARSAGTPFVRLLPPRPRTKS